MVDLSLDSTRNVNTFFTGLFKLLERVGAQLRVLSLSIKQQNRAKQRDRIQHLCQLNDACCNIFLSVSELTNSQISIEEQSKLFQIVQLAPNLITDEWNLIKDTDFATLKHLEPISIEKFICSRTRVTQALVHFLINYYRNDFVSNERRLKIILDNLDKYEFLIRFDEIANLQKELSAFLSKQICTEQQMCLVIKALENAYEQKRKEIKNLLSQQGILQFIGYPKEKYIADQIQDLGEIIPDLSKQQIHLCLRHFGYDFEKTLEGLCERDQLPLDLKILLRMKDPLDDAEQSRRRIPMLNDERIANESGVEYFDENLSEILAKAQNIVDQLSIDEATVEFNEMVSIRKGADLPLSAEDRKTLIATSLRRAHEIEEDEYKEFEDDEGQRDDIKLAAEVGESGRFNRLDDIIGMGDNIYDDEYDDSYEYAQLYTGRVDLSANSFDEKEILAEDRHWQNEGGKAEHSGQFTIPQKMQQKEHDNRMNTKSGLIVKNSIELKEGTSANKKVAKTATPTEGKMSVQQRRLKEQNKGKELRKGADRKMKGIFLENQK